MRVRAGIVIENAFSSAHHLKGHAKCGRVHGHDYKLEVEISRDLQNYPTAKGLTLELEESFVMDFGKLKRFIKTLTDRFDHDDLNKDFAHPTAERIAIWFFDTIGGWLWSMHIRTTLDSVTIWETDTAYAKVTREDQIGA